MTGYYRRFIQNYAQKAAPLTELTKKGRPEIVEWNDAGELAFQTLKTALTYSTLLKNPNSELTFILQTDASNIGVGAILSQRDSLGNDYPIAYFSKKLLDQEQKYATVHKECCLGTKE